MADREPNYRIGKSQNHKVSGSRGVLGLLLLTLLGFSSTGCSTFSGLGNSFQYNDCCNDFMLGFRNRAWSARSWHEKKKCYKNQKHIHDFCRGFRQGYEDVASGKDGCVPAFPPREYWGWKYQSPEGQCKVNAWFAGYPMGAKAAEEDGLGYYSQIQTSGCMEQQFAAHGLAPAPPAPPQAPIPTTHPTERIPGLDGLLNEGESIIDMKVAPAPPQPTKSAMRTESSGSATPSHIPMPPPIAVVN